MTLVEPTSVPSDAALAPVQQPAPKWWPLVRWLLVAVCVWPLLMVAAPGVLKVPRYDVAGGQIMARSVITRTVIPAGTPYEKTSIGLTRRIYGNATPGYYTGRFDTTRGEVALYSDGSSSGLLFATQPPTFITPADPDALLTAWKGGATASFRPARNAQLGWGAAAFLLLIPGLAVVGSLFISKPRLTYAIQGDTFTVKTRASTTHFPRTGTSASLTSHALGMRLFGTAIPGYYTGTFSTRGGNVQAAASSARPGQALLLEYGSKRYYLTPSDPAAVAAWFGSSEQR